MIRILVASLLAASLTLGCSQADKSPPTIDDWKQALDASFKVLSTQQQENGNSLSVVCFPAKTESGCVKAQMLRMPYEQKRVFFLPGQPLSDKLRIVPSVHLDDGQIPMMNVEVVTPKSGAPLVTGFGVLLNGDLVLQDPTQEPPIGESRPTSYMQTSIVTPAQLEQLRKVDASSTVSGRIEGIDLKTIPNASVEKHLDQTDAQQLKEGLRVTTHVHDALSEALTDVIPGREP